MFYISYGCSYIDGPAAFRVPWGLQMIPAIFLGFALFLTPESPRWLAKKDRWEECHNVLALVHAKGNREAPFVLRELQEIKDMCEFERRNVSLSALPRPFHTQTTMLTGMLHRPMFLTSSFSSPI
jgi:hypothetical protein